ncbi:hypothetical protein SLE2022_073860 [Rubroshorea leprosula]
MSFQQDREELDGRARKGEVVVPGGTGGKSLEAQEHLAEGRAMEVRGGRSTGARRVPGVNWAVKRSEHEEGADGDGRHGEMGREGELSTMDKSEGQRAEEEDISTNPSSELRQSGS